MIISENRRPLFGIMRQAANRDRNEAPDPHGPALEWAAA
jgi:hypothetical protein